MRVDPDLDPFTGETARREHDLSGRGVTQREATGDHLLDLDHDPLGHGAERTADGGPSLSGDDPGLADSAFHPADDT